MLQKQGCWVLGGDFNAVKSREERVGKHNDSRSIFDFSSFIRDLNLIDLQMGGRKFTWYNTNGESMSMLDRFLILQDMMPVLGSCTQIGLNRKISDHFPIILKSDSRDWGPRPFKSLNCWTEHECFAKLAAESWNSKEITGWAGYKCKEKFKNLKTFLKAWNKERFGNFDDVINMEANKIADLDLANEERDLEDNEVLLRSNCFSKIRNLL